jgi:hypothetical protein
VRVLRDIDSATQCVEIGIGVEILRSSRIRKSHTFPYSNSPIAIGTADKYATVRTLTVDPRCSPAFWLSPPMKGAAHAEKYSHC